MKATAGTSAFQPSLVDVAKPQKWRGSRALVPLPVGRCPDCDEPLHRATAAQLPLLRHGGYGAISADSVLSCVCGYVRSGGTTSENPRDSDNAQWLSAQPSSGPTTRSTPL